VVGAGGGGGGGGVLGGSPFSYRDRPSLLSRSFLNARCRQTTTPVNVGGVNKVGGGGGGDTGGGGSGRACVGGL